MSVALLCEAAARTQRLKCRHLNLRDKVLKEAVSEMQAVGGPAVSMAFSGGAVSTVQAQLLDILHESESQRKEIFSAFETAVRTAQQLQVCNPCSAVRNCAVVSQRMARPAAWETVHLQYMSQHKS